MKKDSKRIIVLLSLALALVLSGCSESAQEALQEDSSSGADSTASADLVQIDYWYGLGSVAGETMQAIIDDFNNSQDEVRVNGVSQASYGDTLQQIQASLAAGNAPALYIVDNTYNSAVQGFLETMDDLPEEINGDDYLEVFWSQGDIDGSRYSIPAYGTTQVMYYRSDILEEAGIDPEEMYSSWENVRQYSEQLIADGHVEQGHLPMYGTGNMIDIALSNGGEVFSEDGTQVTINTPEWVQSWTHIQDGIKDQVWHVNSGGQGWEYWYNTIDEVMTGQAIGYTGSSGDKGDLDFAIIGSAEQPGLNGNEPQPTASALQFGIPKGTEDAQKQAAYKFIAYFTSPEVQAQWSQKIGYIPVNNKTPENEEYTAFLEENPAYAVPYNQALHSTPAIVDPTGGQVMDAISIAVDQVQLEGIDPQTALDEAQEKAQAALDEYLAQQ